MSGRNLCSIIRVRMLQLLGWQVLEYIGGIQQRVVPQLCLRHVLDRIGCKLVGIVPDVRGRLVLVVGIDSMQQLLGRHLLDGVRGGEQQHVRELHSRLLLILRWGIDVGGVPDVQGRAVHDIPESYVCQLHGRDVLDSIGGMEQQQLCELHYRVLLGRHWS